MLFCKLDLRKFKKIALNVCVILGLVFEIGQISWREKIALDNSISTAITTAYFLIMYSDRTKQRQLQNEKS